MNRQRRSYGVAAGLLLAFALALVLALSVFELRFAPSEHGPASASGGQPALVLPAIAAFKAQVDGRPPSPGKSIEVCGFGRIAVEEAAALSHELDRLLARPSPALVSALSAMQASGHAADQALAHYIEAVLSSGAAQRNASARTGENCVTQPACADRLAAIGRDAAIPYIGPLIRLAEEGKDEVAIALAVQACTRQTEVAVRGCERLTRRYLAESDPDIAAAWIYVANDAARRQDTAAQAAAMARAASAKRFDTYAERLLAPLLQSSSGSHSDRDRLAMHMQVTGVFAAWPMPDTSILREWCSATAMQDAGRRRECNQLAEMMVSQNHTTYGLLAGIALAKRLDWPQERVERLALEWDAIQFLMAEEQPAVTDELSCGALQRAEQTLRSLFQHGELGRHRQRIVSSGRSVDQLAQAWRLRSAQAVAPGAAR